MVQDRLDTGQFSEKDFYLEEFRGRTLGILVPGREAAEHPGLSEVVDELGANRTRVLLVAPRRVDLSRLQCEVLPADADRIEGRLWRALRGRSRVAVTAGDRPFAALLDLARRLQLHKVILLAETAAAVDREGRPRSFVDGGELARLLGEAAGERAELLRETQALLEAGVPNVNVCTAAALGGELFSFTGAGTLFTRERYVVVRKLGVDDYDAADGLIARGVAEGYLLERPPEAIDRLLATGFGAFVEATRLAGVGSLQPVAGSGGAELASLYTLTRFVGAGLGGQLVSHGLDAARELDLDYVFACTTSDQVGAFFRRCGFEAVGHDRVPPEKWLDYSSERRERVMCFRHQL